MNSRWKDFFKNINKKFALLPRQMQKKFIIPKWEDEATQYSIQRLWIEAHQYALDTPDELLNMVIVNEKLKLINQYEAKLKFNYVF